MAASAYVCQVASSDVVRRASVKSEVALSDVVRRASVKSEALEYPTASSTEAPMQEASSSEAPMQDASSTEAPSSECPSCTDQSMHDVISTEGLCQPSQKAINTAARASPAGSRMDAPPSECTEGMGHLIQDVITTEPLGSLAASDSERLSTESDAEEVIIAKAADESVVEGLAAILERLAASAPQQQAMTYFHSKTVPPVSIRQYLARLRTYFFCSTECYVVALVYIQRLLKRCPGLVVSKLSCHRMLLSSLLLAVKFNDDHFYTNKFYAKAGGLVLKELNKLESLMLHFLQFDLFVSESEYNVCLASLGEAVGTGR